MEPLADAELRRQPGEGFGGGLRRAVLAQDAHVEMPVIGGALGLAVPGRRLPGARQVIEAVPMDPRRLADEKLGRPFQSPDLDLLGAEGRDADLADPDRQVGDGADLVDLRRPFVDLPQVPVEREAVHGDRVDVVEHPLVRHVADEGGIDRRHAAEHARKRGVLGPDRLPRGDRGLGEAAPARVELGVPMGLVVGLVPDHRRFDHSLLPRAG